MARCVGMDFDPIAAMVATFSNMAADMLAKGEYEDLAAWTNGRHLSAVELRRRVGPFDGRLVRIRSAGKGEPDSRSMRHEDRTTYDLSVPMWTDEGQSALTLEVRIVEFHDGRVGVEVLDVHKISETDPARAPVARTEPLPKNPKPRPREAPPKPSDHPVPERWRPLLAEIIHRLVIGDYAGLARDGSVSYTDDPSDDSIGMWIEDYPWRMVDLPEEAWAFSDHFQVGPNSWSVVVSLWTAEEGLSDLSLEAIVYEDGPNVTVKVDMVHVM